MRLVAEKKNIGRHLIIYIREAHVEVVYLTGVTGVKGEIYMSVISIEVVPDVVSFDNMTSWEHIKRRKVTVREWSPVEPHILEALYAILVKAF